MSNVRNKPAELIYYHDDAPLCLASGCMSSLD
jgi:hypothetical protein